MFIDRIGLGLGFLIHCCFLYMRKTTSYLCYIIAILLSLLSLLISQVCFILLSRAVTKREVCACIFLCTCKQFVVIININILSTKQSLNLNPILYSIKVTKNKKL